MNNNKTEEDGAGILIHGHGTLSGDRLPHPSHAENLPEDEHWRYHGINIDGTKKSWQQTFEKFQVTQCQCLGLDSEVHLLLLVMIIVYKYKCPIFTSLNVS